MCPIKIQGIPTFENEDERFCKNPTGANAGQGAQFFRGNSTRLVLKQGCCSEFEVTVCVEPFVEILVLVFFSNASINCFLFVGSERQFTVCVFPSHLQINSYEVRRAPNMGCCIYS